MEALESLPGTLGARQECALDTTTVAGHTHIHTLMTYGQFSDPPTCMFLHNGKKLEN